MSYCLNPNCHKPHNPPENLFCLNCGSKLILRERYRALKVIGQGGFGKTFLAVDQDKPSKPRCIIKQFYPQAQGTDNATKAAELFDREAVRLDDLGKHTQIPELLAHFSQDNRQYLVQQFIDGQNLAQILEQEGTFKEAQIRHLLNSLLPVLQFIHERDVIHRDIKPENIIQKHDGELFLVDFGAAKYAIGTALMKTGTVIGTAEYIAPEQTRGKAVFASDLYSFGVTCIHLLTGISPFDLFDVSEDSWVWRQFLVDNPISEELAKTLDKLIENGTKRRYQSAQEAINVLKPQVVINQIHQKVSLIESTPTISTSQANTLKLQSFEFDVVFLKEVTAFKFIEERSFWGKKTTRQFPETKLQTVVKHHQAEFFSEYLDGISLDMVAIPGGTFMMGSHQSEKGHKDCESPQHQVTVPPFYMGKYPVTQAQYKAVMGKNPSYFRGDKKPVTDVSWDDAKKFCAKLSQKTGKNYRLPSEAEWEYACRAGTTTSWHFGNIITPKVANYKTSEDVDHQHTTDVGNVGSFPANAFGLYDMHGNVWEWCADPWHDSYNGAPSDGSVWEQDGSGKCSIVRGGASHKGSWDCRSANRYNNSGGFFWLRGNSYIGFRVVLSSGRT
ncbi:bifunctional serine/threonine-protein kinase/formylglycine-generating enzyme family protein [Merismopedia glauca]|uniref:Serine/threonine protein kinase n=1 Tax=Merismopedia glauca CCAP 1448/3 TaxID=1296344 RepID=A0A2T1C7L7_9CYAN|nr:bifunctional serine/threonine-protein kinase/formylglycine-generating enzyme family protein [Merismopedia glauca]PSB04249.1 serine/threonine protein kinase [Merismopedia glauca CCAP 1448/3]